MSHILKAFLENETAIRRYVARLCSGVSEIDDVAQETFLRGFAAETRRDIAEPKAYLFQIAKNVCLEKIRKTTGPP